MRARTSLALLFAASLSACAIDDPAIDSDDGDDGKADATNPTAGYYRAHYLPDGQCSLSSLERCGLQISWVNRASTRCLDGRVGSECGVSSIDWTRTDLSREELARYPQPVGVFPSSPFPYIIKGQAERQGDLTVLMASELWVPGSAAGTAGGLVVLAQQNGVFCDTPTCPKYDERELNSDKTAALARVRLEDANPLPDDLLMAKDLLDYTSYGVIVAGDRFTVSDGGKQALGRTAHQYYLRAPVPLSW